MITNVLPPFFMVHSVYCPTTQQHSESSGTSEKGESGPDPESRFVLLNLPPVRIQYSSSLSKDTSTKKFQEDPISTFLRKVANRQTERQRGRQTDEQTDKQTPGRHNLFGGGILKNNESVQSSNSCTIS